MQVYLNLNTFYLITYLGVLSEVDKTVENFSGDFWRGASSAGCCIPFKCFHFIGNNKEWRDLHLGLIECHDPQVQSFQNFEDFLKIQMVKTSGL